MPFLFIFALVVGIAVLYWMILKNSAERIVAQFAILAQNLGLELSLPEPTMWGFIRPEPSLYGKYKGRELSISVPGKGLQNTRQIETLLKLELKEQKFSAQLTGQGLLGSMRQRDSKGMDRWKSGDTVFDSAVDARTNDAAKLHRLLTKEAQQSLMALFKQGKGSIYIGAGVITYAELGLIANDSLRQRFESVVELFLLLADSIESA
ncbi:MAG: hypothetical protein ACPGSB_00070 [Opitutales bacterium]